MAAVKRAYANGAGSNGDLKRVVAFGGTEVVSRRLYDDLAKQIADCHELLDQHGVPTTYNSLCGRVGAALRYAEMRGAVWADDEEYQDYVVMLDDASNRR